MQVILLATDEAMQLRPFGNRLPAPLAPIANRPVIARAIEILARAGIKQVMVSLCHNSGSVMSRLGDGGRWGIQIEYLIQREGLGTAGALRWAAPRLSETCLVLPADAILDLDIDDALAYHRSHGGAATAILHSPVGGRLANPVRCDSRGRVLGADGEAHDARTLCDTGAYIFEPHVVQLIPFGQRYDCYGQLLPALLAAGQRAYGYTMQGYWNPLDSFQAYQEAQQVFLYSAYTVAGRAASADIPRVRYPSIEGRQIAPGIWVGANHAIHPGALLAPPVLIGADCRVGREVELGPVVVLGAGVVIDDGATIQHSTVLENTYVGRLVNGTNRIISKSTLIDPDTSMSAEVVDTFLLSEIKAPEGAARLNRLMQRSIALLVLLLGLPPMLAIGIILWLTLGRPILRRTPCVGRRVTPRVPANEPETFELYAFRTQRTDETSGAFGRWLRRWELDRLPALWHVVAGDIALVGTRPLTPAEATKLREVWHHKRHECPTGFTGLWYVQADDESDLEAILVADAYYAATHTWRADLRLLWRTPIAWLRRVRRWPVERAQNEHMPQIDRQTDTQLIDQQAT
jgi:NDP-sugar pyrophosphorylase family protein